MKTLRQITAAALLSAILYAQQVALAFLPNIHLCALLIMLYTLCFPRFTPMILAVFILLEGFTYGFGIWWLSYLYIWPLLALLTWLLRKNESPGFWAALSGLHGFCCGALFSLPYLFIGGFSAAFSYWIAGIPFDIVHSLGNIVLTLALWKPLYKLLWKYRIFLGEDGNERL